MIIKKNTEKLLNFYIFFLLVVGIPDCFAYNVIGTGPQGSNYKEIGNQLSQFLGPSSVIESSGSTTNLRGLLNGEFTVAIAQSDIANSAYQGTGAFERIGKFSTLRAIGTAYVEYIYVVVPADSTIKTFKDLQGKHLSMGLPGSGTLATATAILSAYGLNSSEYMPHYLSFKKLAKQLKMGKVDAAFIIDKLPSEQLLTLSKNMQIRLIPIKLSDISPLTPAYNHYKQSLIPGEIYNITQDTPTLTVEAQVFTTSSMPPEMAFRLAAIIKRNATSDVKNLNSLKLTAVDYPPLHIGAADFYRREELG